MSKRRALILTAAITSCLLTSSVAFADGETHYGNNVNQDAAHAEGQGNSLTYNNDTFIGGDITADKGSSITITGGSFTSRPDTDVTPAFGSTASNSGKGYIATEDTSTINITGTKIDALGISAGSYDPTTKETSHAGGTITINNRPTATDAAAALTEAQKATVNVDAIMAFGGNSKVNITAYDGMVPSSSGTESTASSQVTTKHVYALGGGEIDLNGDVTISGGAIDPEYPQNSHIDSQSKLNSKGTLNIFNEKMTVDGTFTTTGDVNIDNQSDITLNSAVTMNSEVQVDHQSTVNFNGGGTISADGKALELFGGSTVTTQNLKFTNGDVSADEGSHLTLNGGSFVIEGSDGNSQSEINVDDANSSIVANHFTVRGGSITAGEFKGESSITPGKVISGAGESTVLFGGGTITLNNSDINTYHITSVDADSQINVNGGTVTTNMIRAIGKSDEDGTPQGQAGIAFDDNATVNTKYVGANNGTISISKGTIDSANAVTDEDGNAVSGIEAQNHSNITLGSGVTVNNEDISVQDGSTLTMNGGKVNDENNTVSVTGASTLNADGTNLTADSLTAESDDKGTGKTTVSIKNGTTKLNTLSATGKNTSVSIDGTNTFKKVTVGTNSDGTEGAAVALSGTTTIGPSSASSDFNRESLTNTNGTLNLSGTTTVNGLFTTNGTTNVAQGGSLTANRVYATGGTVTADGEVNSNNFTAEGANTQVHLNGGGTLKGDTGYHDALYIRDGAQVTTNGVNFRDGMISVDDGSLAATGGSYTASDPEKGWISTETNGKVSIDGMNINAAGIGVGHYPAEEDVGEAGGGSVEVKNSIIHASQGIFAAGSEGDRASTVHIENSQVAADTVGAYDKGSVTINGGTPEVSHVEALNHGTVNITSDSGSIGDIHTETDGTVHTNLSGAAKLTGNVNGDGSAAVQLSNGAQWTGTSAEGSTTTLQLDQGGVWAPSESTGAYVSQLNAQNGTVRADNQTAPVRVGRFRGHMLFAMPAISRAASNNVLTIDHVEDAGNGQQSSIVTTPNREQGSTISTREGLADFATDSSKLVNVNTGDLLYGSRTAEGLTTPAMETSLRELGTNGAGAEFTANDVRVGSRDTAIMRGARSAMATPMMVWRNSFIDHQTRIGDLRGGAGAGVWARTYGGKSKYDKNGAYARDSFWGAQVGADALLSSGWYLGGAFDYYDGDGKYDYGGSGSPKAYIFSLYGTKLMNHGRYIDIVARGGHVKNDYTTYNADQRYFKGDYAANGYGLSVEYGRRFTMNENYVEPQVQLAYSRLGSDDYTGDTDFQSSPSMHIHQDAMNSVLGRIGVEAGHSFGARGNIYAAASLVHEFDGDTHTKYYAENEVPVSVHEDYKDTWTDLAIGGNYYISPTVYLYGNVHKTFGGDYNLNWRANLGIRFVF